MMVMNMSLTGRTRHRLRKMLTGYILVLQVEVERSAFGYLGTKTNITCWRDAKVEDLTELDIKGVEK